jgi:hypothetical protein
MALRSRELYWINFLFSWWHDKNSLIIKFITINFITKITVVQPDRSSPKFQWYALPPPQHYHYRAVEMIEGEGKTFFRNVGNDLHDLTASDPRWK